MEKNYDPLRLEKTWYERWIAKEVFTQPFDPKKPTFSLPLPPPNVTGTLHMGHAFQQTLMDILSRYHRMNGYNVHWQIGTDHAGIATQMVVERDLLQAGIAKEGLTREAFIDHIWAWEKRSGATILQQMQRLGISPRWDKTRFTLDAQYSKAVQQAFLTLYEAGLIYRGKRLVNWDPKLQTALSDLEVITTTLPGKLWHLHYPVSAAGERTQVGANYLTVATTRPETLFGDCAIAVHPDDRRYQHLIGKTAWIPIIHRPIPIIGDTYVDPMLGSGALKVTPAHDFNDHAIGQAHRLPLIQIFTATGTFRDSPATFYYDGSPNPELTTTIPQAIQGMDRLAAREWTLQALERDGRLGAIEPHTLSLPMGDRSGAALEPMLTDQWFIRVETLAESAQQAVASGQIRFVPSQYENLYTAWMNHIQDWCISRQLWWGHRIPAWYDERGEVYVGDSIENVRKKYSLSAELSLRQETDVLDTWFSSGLWSFAALGWPDQTEDLARYHPSTVVLTGFDIIFFWVARMIMLTRHLIKSPNGSPQNPFSTVYITGLIRDERGEKMSKSKGNVLDPIDMIEGISAESLVQKRSSHLMQPRQRDEIKKQTQKNFPHGIAPHGADALRMTLSALASTGRDIHWDMQRLNGYRNFCNKLWHATRFVIQTLEQCPGWSDPEPNAAAEDIVDRWIQSAFQGFLEKYHESMATYRFDLATQALHEFTWHQFCDWYLECTKIQIAQGSKRAQATCRRLYSTLASLLSCAHPTIPFITDALWENLASYRAQTTPSQTESLLQTQFPRVQKGCYDPEAVAGVQWMQQALTALRQFRAGSQRHRKHPLTVWLATDDLTLQRQLPQLMPYLLKLGYCSVHTTQPPSEIPVTALILENATLYLQTVQGGPSQVEHQKLLEVKRKLQQEIAAIEEQLSNERFLARAPQAVIEKRRTELAGYQTRQRALTIPARELNSTEHPFSTG